MTHTIFLSYPHADRPAARALRAALEAAGLRVFIDERDIRDAASISETITRTISQCKLLVAWYSFSYGRSRACQWEMTAAWLAGEAEGDPLKRVMAVNPEAGVEHIHPAGLRDARLLSTKNLEDTARRIADHVKTLESPLSEVPRFQGETWHGRRRDSSNRFVGRVKELWQVHSALSNGGERSTVMVRADTARVQGMGGIGKSLLAEEYARRFAAAYPGGILWLAANQERNPQLSTLAERFGLPEATEGPERVAAGLQRHLKGLGNYLWIADDLPSTASVDVFRDWLAPTGNGRTIITTRGTRWAANGLVVPLDTLGDDDARVLLTTRRPPRDNAERAAAEALITALGGHPLALDVAGASIVERGYARTLEDATDHSQDVLDLAADLGEELPTGHEKSIAATLLHSIRRLDDRGQAFLHLAAVLGQAPIPWELVEEVFAAQAEDEKTGRRNAAKALSAARAESLSSNLEDGTDLVHALVSRTVRLHAPPPDGLRGLVVAVMNRVLPDVVDIRTHDRLRPWLPQARALTEIARDEATLALLGWVGWYALERGDYPAARAVFERQAQESRRGQGEEHPATLTAMNNLASTLRAQGDLAGARGLEEQVLALRRRVLGEKHPDTLISMGNLANTLWAQGDLAGARGLEEQVLALLRRVLGEEHPDTLTSMNNLAGTLRAQGDLAGARRLHEQVLALHRRVLGEEHPDTLTSMNNLAGTLRAQGDLAGARGLHEQVLALRRRVLGEEHPATLTSMNNLAGTLWAQGDLAGARRLEEQVLALRRRVLGEEHPDTLTSVNNLARTLLQSGDPAGAAALVAEALPVSRRKLGEAHPITQALLKRDADLKDLPQAPGGPDDL